MSERKGYDETQEYARSLLHEVVTDIVVPIPVLQPLLLDLWSDLSSLKSVADEIERDQDGANDVREGGRGELSLARMVERGEESGLEAKERHECRESGKLWAIEVSRSSRGPPKTN